ncbi:MAG: relaxase/mobilization nuclease domain-containing protein [Flavobacteriales bacterium]|nr:relaxase/mobilization nuclease domain-containing protein [Flavobacteriales bacterium]
MIIKEKSIKSYVVLEKTLRYILSKNSYNNFVFRKFIRGDREFERQLELVKNDTEVYSLVMENRLQEMQKQFIINDKQRLYKRTSETKFYHSIVSFSKKDRLTNEQLLSVVKQFTKLRFPNSIVVATNHSDKEHQHIHLIGSNVEYGIHTTNYLTKEQFKNIKIAMEQFQDRELRLQHSRIDHSKKKVQSLLKDAEYQINLKGKLTEKQEIKLILDTEFSRAKSESDFYERLKANKLELYFRGNQPGIMAKRKYRLKSLGFSLERIQALNLSKNLRQQELNRIIASRMQKNKDNEREL